MPNRDSRGRFVSSADSWANFRDLTEFIWSFDDGVPPIQFHDLYDHWGNRTNPPEGTVVISVNRNRRFVLDNGRWYERAEEWYRTLDAAIAAAHVRGSSFGWGDPPFVQWFDLEQSLRSDGNQRAARNGDQIRSADGRVYVYNGVWNRVITEVDSVHSPDSRHTIRHTPIAPTVVEDDDEETSESMCDYCGEAVDRYGDCGNCHSCDNPQDYCTCCSECGSPDSDHHYCGECDSYHCRSDGECSRYGGAIMDYGELPGEVAFLSMKPYDHSDKLFPFRKEMTCYSSYPDAPDTEPYLGMEIECEAAHCDAGDVATFWNNSGLGWSTHDGSLSDGVECKTHPSTYAYLRQSNLAETLDKMGDMGARAWGYNSCGLHIHVSRKAFEKKSHEWRFAYLHYPCFASELKQIAGRKGHTHYCEFPDDTSEKRMVNNEGYDYVRDRDGNFIYVKETPTRIIAGKMSKQERSVAVNVNDETIEMRYWKGSLNPKTVLGAAAIEDAMIQYSRQITFKEIRDNPTFSEFMTWCYHSLDETQYTHISDLVKARNVPFVITKEEV